MYKYYFVPQSFYLVLLLGLGFLKAATKQMMGLEGTILKHPIK
jgi:hypothetical protein